MMKILSIAFLIVSLSLVGCGGSSENEFRSSWPDALSRPWAGPDYWTNPLQDWRIRDGRLENHVAGGDRNAFLLTREISEREGTIETSVRFGRLDAGEELEEGFVGFRVGIRGHFDDYRDSAVRGDGLNAGITTDGRLFIGRLDADAPAAPAALDGLTLRFSAAPADGSYRAVLEVLSGSGEPLAQAERDDIGPDWLPGGIALVSSSGDIADTPAPRGEVPAAVKQGLQRGGTTRFWFEDWTVAGTKIDAHPERAFGPILFSMYTLSEGVLKLSAQLAPIDGGETEATLETRDGDAWNEIARAEIEANSRSVVFRVADWDDAKDTPYRVLYEDDAWEGTVRKDPVDKDEIVVAAFTGNNDLGFPHADIVRNVKHFDPDLLAYTGDNIYERVGEYGIQRDPTDAAILDYLRKWFIFGWEYRELLREIPSVALPDDHDVYQGNIWGAGGRHATEYGQTGQDQGGFVMDERFVKVVYRTQTSNMPDPYDPTPIEQGIPVYYNDLHLGGVSFAVLADRMWKSAPKVAVPVAKIINGWSKNPRYDASRQGDVSGAELLGPRQEEFLEAWAADWSGGVWMKSVISQTIFANVATLPAGTDTDAVTGSLRVMPPGEYAQGDAPVQDHDSNGWPQRPRNRAVGSMRKALAFHIAGDQHLGSMVQYGVDAWDDASWAICVPSVANIFPRRWFPPKPGGNHKEGAPTNTGEYLDGFGNKITVHAVSNPIANGVEPTAINHRAPGYGIIRFDRATRKITAANWPRWVDAGAADAAPYPGWPITIEQLDNGFPADGLALEAVTTEVDDPVVQVVGQSDGEIVYTVRIRGREFTPRVRKPGVYTVRAFDPDGDYEWKKADLRPN